MTIETALLNDFPVRITIPVLWGDMDAFKHVNNAIHFKWFESSRAAYLERANLAEMLDGVGLGPILASVNCNYRRQIQYPDTVHIGARVSCLGKTSMTIDHAIASEKQEQIAADGQSTIVVFDYTSQRPVRIPEKIRDAISMLQGIAPLPQTKR